MENRISQPTLSYWHDSVAIPDFPPLVSDGTFDVAIVGGGIAGLTTAYLLARQGKSVCVLESDKIGAGQTGQTTAHFSSALDDTFIELERLFGREGSRLAAQSHMYAIRKVKEIVSREGIECDLRTLSGFLFSGPGESTEFLHEEFDAAFRAGLVSINLLPRAPIEHFDTGPCIEFPSQMQLHPLKYLVGLADAVTKQGGQIFHGTHIIEIKGGRKAYVRSKEGFTIKAKSIVVTTNTPINDTFPIHTKQAPYRSYVIALKVARGSVPQILLWDTLDPYHYIRTQKFDDQFDLLIVGGEDHKTGQNTHPEECFERLRAWTDVRFQIDKELAYKWSGQVLEPVDALAYLGHNPVDRNNVYIITGDSGHGMTHCTIGGLLVTDQILEKTNIWGGLYDPSRVNIKAVKEYVKENLNVAAQYGEWFRNQNEQLLRELSPGHGLVINKGIHKIAVYRELEGELTFRSAKCPHLGGVVRWNNVEGSWDCPCHGSRFNCKGKVIEGPAIDDLPEIEFDEESARKMSS
jgi:glycine/D-amino acid oxidase-like deaminating enzyme/nitrite reductase/ring-hydroxylating ferredoxin subunit